LERLSGLPLALTQAAAYIGQTAVNIDQYLEHYDTMWKDLMEQQDKYPLQEYAERSVLTTWKISYEQVKSQNEAASNLLQLWSFLYTGDLWYEMIACAKELKAKTVGRDWLTVLAARIKGLRAKTIVPDWLTVLAKDRLAFDGALRLLTKYSLVEVKTDTTSYAMHSVLHSWCRYLGASEAERGSFQKLALMIVGTMVPAKSTKEYWIFQRRLLPHGQAVFDGMKSKREAEITTNETWAYKQLAGMFVNQDRYLEAETMYKRALAMRKKLRGSKHRSTLNIINDLGILYSYQGRYPEAEAMFEHALACREKGLGFEHADTLMTVNSLGNVYLVQGKLVQAEAMYKRALAGKGKALGPGHSTTLVTVNSLGNLYLVQGKLVQAEAMYKRALAGYEKTLGPTHTTTLDTVNNLGILYSNQGRLIEAEAMLKRAIAGFEKALGSTHTSTLDIVHNLGMLYHQQGRLVEAEAMYNRALAGKEKALGPTHTSTLETVHNLSILYRKQGRLVEAEALYERALGGYGKALGPKHTSTLRAANNLAILHDHQAASQRQEMIAASTHDSKVSGPDLGMAQPE
jgi:tetratricopeptide (TPR) repeat protein